MSTHHVRRLYRRDRVTAHELARGMVVCLADQMTRWQGRKNSDVRHRPIAKTCVDLDNQGSQDVKSRLAGNETAPYASVNEPRRIFNIRGLAETPGIDRSRHE